MGKLMYKDGSGFLEVGTVGPAIIIATGGTEREDTIIVSNDEIEWLIEELQRFNEDYMRRIKDKYENGELR
jgi:tetrahydromethanopterin S-methyltransferase subunit B